MTADRLSPRERAAIEFCAREAFSAFKADAKCFGHRADLIFMREAVFAYRAVVRGNLGQAERLGFGETRLTSEETR